MDRSQLEKASHAELIELVIKQDETFQSLLEAHHQLLARVHELEEQASKPKKTSRNSSSRPSSDRKAGAKKSSRSRKKVPNLAIPERAESGAKQM